jgi:sterol desaturase/sphingolipid hydroxylase (fatty acid hydroxylase superfamily)
MDFDREMLLLLISAPILLVVILIEVAITNWHAVRGEGTRRYSWRESLTNGWLALLNGSFDILLRGLVLLALGWAWQHRLVTFERSWIYWVALLVIEDFAFWLLHYVDHKCRFFWAIHVTHHSSEEFNLTTGFRSSVFQPFYRTIYFLPLAFFGFQPLDILFMYAVTQLYGVLVHTEWKARFGWLEHLLVTPSHHRVHHASNGRYLDKNMGMVFIVWDKIFGTFAPEDPADPPKYGITKPIPNRGPFGIVLHEWRDLFRDVKEKGRTLREKLAYIFRPPGWAPKSQPANSAQPENESSYAEANAPRT